MPSLSPRILLRYWGSHLKSPGQAAAFAAQFVVLSARGWRCCLAMERPPEDPQWLQPLRDADVETMFEPRPRSNWDWRCILRVRRLCRRLRPSVLHCDNMHTNTLLGAALAGVPVRVWSKRSMNADFEQARAPSWKERLALSTRVSCALATRVIAVSGEVKVELMRKGIADRKVWIRHNPRPARRSSPFVGRAAARRDLDFSESDILVVTIGHAVPVKGWDILLRAFCRVAREEPRARLALVGSCAGPTEKTFFEKLNQYASDDNLKGKVRFLGRLLDVQPALDAADVFVSPSRSEGFSNAVIEAVEAGLPCVASRVGIACQVIRDGANGFLIDRCAEDALVGALLKLVQDDAMRGQFAAQAKVPDCIPTPEEHAQQLALDYESLLPEGD